MNHFKFEEFIRIAKKLNEHHIIPLLRGSVGLEVVTGVSWDAKDLDIHVPGDKRGWDVPPEQSIDNWTDIVTIMNAMEYHLICTNMNLREMGYPLSLVLLIRYQASLAYN